MFYEGILQEGISKAVGQQKLVFCFVTNDNDESQTWENEYLQDDSLKDVITKRAIALRLTAGSEEAGYLSQIFPLPQTPTIVIMKHGELKEYIASGTTKEDFLRRVQNSFDIPPSPSQPTASTAQPASSDALSSSPPSTATAPAGSSHLAGVPATIEQSDNVRRVLEERAAKQQAAKQAAEEKAKEELARQKKQAQQEAEAGKSAQKQKQAELLKKKKQQEADERKRILKRIQDDKEERRKQAQQREKQRLDVRSTSDWSSPVASSAPQSRRASSTKTGEFTSIQVRLFDGSTIRSRFKTSSPVKEIRKWVDDSRTDGSVPYAFKQLLTPLPNRPVDDTEEDQSIGEVGLSPSSTLILVPVRSFASAYDDSSRGLFSHLLGVILGFFTWLFGLAGFGGGSSSHTQSASEQSSSSGSTQAKSRRVQGFENPDDRRRDHQLYNGNSLNFEPRPDEDEKK